MQREINLGRVEWRMKYNDGTEEMIFEEERALALLLINEVVFLNSHHWESKWPLEARQRTSLNVNCNDIFAWGCADAETINYEDIESVYRAWRSDETWGTAKWCAFKRNQKPQQPVIEAMKKDGAWDDTMEKLGENTMDAEVHALFAAYAARLREEGQLAHTVSNAEAK